LTLTQEVQLWAGLGFSVVFVAFFMAAFFWGRAWHAGQWVLVRIMASLSAAFAAALFTGSALVDFRQAFGATGTFSFQGAAGFALFFVVWYLFPKFPAQGPPTDGNVTLLAGMTLRDAARMIADKNLDHSRGVDFGGLEEVELNAPLLSDAVINLKDGRIALLRPRDFVGGAVKPYNVILKNDRYQLERTQS
jgi:hypothetical protein